MSENPCTPGFSANGISQIGIFYQNRYIPIKMPINADTDSGLEKNTDIAAPYIPCVRFAFPVK